MWPLRQVEAEGPQTSSLHMESLHVCPGPCSIQCGQKWQVLLISVRENVDGWYLLGVICAMGYLHRVPLYAILPVVPYAGGNSEFQSLAKFFKQRPKWESCVSGPLVDTRIRQF